MEYFNIPNPPFAKQSKNKQTKKPRQNSIKTPERRDDWMSQRVAEQCDSTQDVE